MFWCFVVVEVCQNSSFVSGMQFYLFFVIIHTVVIDTYKLETQYNFIISVFKTMIFELLYHIVFVKYWYFHKNQNLSSSWKWLLLMWRNELNLNFIPPVFCNLSQAKYPCYEKWCLLGSDSFLLITCELAQPMRETVTHMKLLLLWLRPFSLDLKWWHTDPDIDIILKFYKVEPKIFQLQAVAKFEK